MGYLSPLQRRQYVRYEVAGQAAVTSGNALGQPSLLKDLSVRGASIVSDYLLPAGAKVEVLLRAPVFLQEPALRKARVAWCARLDERYWQAGLDFGLDNKISF